MAPLQSSPRGLFLLKYSLIFSLYSSRKIVSHWQNKVQTPVKESLWIAWTYLSALPPTKPPHKPFAAPTAVPLLYRFGEKKMAVFCKGHALCDLFPFFWQPQQSNFQDTLMCWRLCSEWGMSIRQANAKAGSSNWTYCLATPTMSRSSDTGHLQESTLVSE